MRPLDMLLIGLWALSVIASLATIWTPWRLTRGDSTIDLSDQLTGRPISPLHVFAVPAVLIFAPVVLALAGPGRAGAWRTPHLLVGFVLIATCLGAQLLLRREILKAWSQKQADRARAQAVYAKGRSRSARRPG